MPYPLPNAPDGVEARVRILPPIGCPGGEEWSLHHEVPRWLELGYRLGPVPAGVLELFWMPAPTRWNDPLGSTAIELLVNPSGVPPQSFDVSWGDGSTETVPWTPYRPDVPAVRHIYLQRQDLTVTVTMGLTVTALSVALIGCPLLPGVVQAGLSGSSSPVGGGLAGIEPLVPGDGIDGLAYNGSRTEVWRLRLHPEGGLALLPSPVDGKPALVAMYGSGAASRGTRWYSGDGPPPSIGLMPPPAPGDLYLDRVAGRVYELMT
ncbi:hypothetical protein KBZ18_11095 [Synechococcus sp. Cruz-9H2]|uniref:hypothetical protein n=1 Tax=unclassified Synechococcus TaxID=2626047 RepID=UPI0020CBEB1B|nr:MULTISPECIES: hypothetical protein [unclassified Synechococcus]MCP9820035.1 hypothetical protein [Synechococcus sp. Cruz-9H2]MCP9844341.1 hypothetical protein [Synechococcus sp. Edmonson 11F2]MCP9856465.1 hypothetical protein [Synechococcus sp. Cruz-9C9]MCP9863760.1 hypothetical protein [Synechococcus sp. Cruz-7E5]MCP9870945.1 hypothetical protein [Synechococcus sp. Cruz-7B9]